MSYSDESPMSTGAWFLTMVILAIPILNLIMYVIWALGIGNRNRVTFCRATILLSLIGAVVYFLLFTPLITAGLPSLGLTPQGAASKLFNNVQMLTPVRREKSGSLKRKQVSVGLRVRLSLKDRLRRASLPPPSIILILIVISPSSFRRRPRPIRGGLFCLFSSVAAALYAAPRRVHRDDYNSLLLIIFISAFFSLQMCLVS